MTEEATDPEAMHLNRDEEEKGAEENQQIQTVEISDGGGVSCFYFVVLYI